MAGDHKLQLLKGVPLFSQCSKANLARIAALVDEMQFPAGRVLMREGRTGDEFFIIMEGRVRVERGGRQIDTMGPGEFMGEIALVDHRPRTATITCETPCTLLVLGHREFHTLLADTPGIADAVLRALAQRLRNLEPRASL